MAGHPRGDINSHGAPHREAAAIDGEEPAALAPVVDHPRLAMPVASPQSLAHRTHREMPRYQGVADSSTTRESVVAIGLTSQGRRPAR